MEKKFFARAPDAAMWLGKGTDGEWKTGTDFSRAWAFDSAPEASAAWDKACRACLVRCVGSGASAPGWVVKRPVFLTGRTPDGMPARFSFYLALIDGRFVGERTGGTGLALVTDECRAKVFGSLDAAVEGVRGLWSPRRKTMAVLPLACQSCEPMAVDGAALDPLASASYARGLRESWELEVPPAQGAAGKSKSL